MEDIKIQLNKVDFNQSDLLNELQQIYETDTNAFYELTGFADVSSLLELFGESFEYSRDRVNQCRELITQSTEDLKLFYNDNNTKLTSLTDRLTSLKSKFTAKKQTGVELVFKEVFESLENIDQVKSTVDIDIYNNKATAGISKLAPAAVLDIKLGTNTTSGVLFGCNCTADFIDTNPTTGKIIVTPITNETFSIFNIYDGSPTTGFEVEKYYIQKKQKLKNNIGYYTSGSGVETEVETAIKDFDLKFNQISTLDGNVKLTDKYTFTNTEPKTPINLELIFTLADDQKVNSIEIDLFKRKFEKVAIIKEVQVFIKSKWITVYTSTVSNNNSITLDTHNLEKFNQVKVNLENYPNRTELITHPFKSNKFQRKSTRSHGLWRTVDKWEAWEREAVYAEIPSINIFDTNLNVTLSDGIKDPVLYSGDGGTFNPLNTLSDSLNAADLLNNQFVKNDFKKVGGIFTGSSKQKGKIIGINPEGASSTLGGAVSKILPGGSGTAKIQGIFNQVGQAASFINSAATVFQAVSLVANIAQKAFSYNHTKTFKEALSEYDVFSGWKSSIGVKDITLIEREYQSFSSIYSNKITLTGKVNKLGLFVDVEKTDNSELQYFLSKDGEAWVEVGNLKNSMNDGVLETLGVVREVYYLINILNKNTFSSSEIKAISLVSV